MWFPSFFLKSQDYIGYSRSCSAQLPHLWRTFKKSHVPAAPNSDTLSSVRRAYSAWLAPWSKKFPKAEKWCEFEAYLLGFHPLEGHTLILPIVQSLKTIVPYGFVQSSGIVWWEGRSISSCSSRMEAEIPLMLLSSSGLLQKRHHWKTSKVKEGYYVAYMWTPVPPPLSTCESRRREVTKHVTQSGGRIHIRRIILENKTQKAGYFRAALSRGMVCNSGKVLSLSCSVQ